MRPFRAEILLPDLLPCHLLHRSNELGINLVDDFDGAADHGIEDRVDPRKRALELPQRGSESLLTLASEVVPGLPRRGTVL